MKAIPIEHDPEIPVVEAVRQGDPHALAELMDRQGRWVRGVIFGVLGRTGEIDDVAQKVWMQVWRQAAQLDDVRRWRVWLYRIARNAASDFCRARQRRDRLQLGVLDRIRGRKPQPRPDQRLALDETHDAVLQAIASLPPLYREPFMLKHLEDWSYEEIGAALGLPVDTVETRLVRARRILRERLAGKVSHAG